MKHCKHYLLFAFAGAVLLLPVASHYAITWDEIKKKARTFVSDDTLQKTMPGAVVAFGLAAGGLYYWWMTKSMIVTIADCQVTQLPVYSQSWWWGEGAASCGYHALLRGMQIVEAKAYSQSNDILQKTLKSSDLIEKYFGQNGIWRQEIIKKRQDDKSGGDWLQGDELEYLWNEQERLGQDIVSQNILCDFIAIDDFNRIDPYGGYSLEGLRELKEDEIGLDKMVWGIQQRLQLMATIKKRSYFYIFGIGDRYNQVEKHWFALVLYQDGNGNREYFLADSKNVLRGNDKRVINLITAIESPIGTEEI